MANESVNVRVLLYLVVCICVVYAYLRICAREVLNAWVTDPRVQPLKSDFIQSRDLRIAILRR